MSVEIKINVRMFSQLSAFNPVNAGNVKLMMNDSLDETNVAGFKFGNKTSYKTEVDDKFNVIFIDNTSLSPTAKR